MAQYLRLYSCLFQTTVRSVNDSIMTLEYLFVDAETRDSNQALHNLNDIHHNTEHYIHHNTDHNHTSKSSAMEDGRYGGCWANE